MHRNVVVARIVVMRTVTVECIEKCGWGSSAVKGETTADKGECCLRANAEL